MIREKLIDRKPYGYVIEERSKWRLSLKGTYSWGQWIKGSKLYYKLEVAKEAKKSRKQYLKDSSFTHQLRLVPLFNN